MNDKNLHRSDRRVLSAGAALRSAAALAPLLALSVGCDSFDVDSLEGSSFEDALTLVSYPDGELRPLLDDFTATGVLVRSRLGGNGTYTYKNGQTSTSGSPDDAVVFEGDDRTIKWVFSRLQGSGNTIEAFMGNNRDVQYTMTVGGETLEVHDYEDNNGSRLTAKGRTPGDNGTLEFDLRFARGGYFESSYGGAETDLNRSVLGTVSGPGFSADLKVNSKFELVSSSLGTVHFLWRRNDSTLKQGSTTYKWDGVIIKVNYKNGVPSNIDQDWYAGGKLKKNGGDWGEYKLVRKGDLGVEVVLDTPGHSYVLERYHLLGSRASCTRSDECTSRVCTNGQCD